MNARIDLAAIQTGIVIVGNIARSRNGKSVLELISIRSKYILRT